MHFNPQFIRLKVWIICISLHSRRCGSWEMAKMFLLLLFLIFNANNNKNAVKKKKKTKIQKKIKQ